MDTLYSFIFAFLGTLFAIYLLIPISSRVGLVDSPGGRKQHKRQTPLIGGIAIFFGFSLAVLIGVTPLGGFRYLFAALALLIFIAVLDDISDLSAKLRLCVQILVAGILVYFAGAKISTLGGGLNLGIFSTVFSLFVIVGYLNAMNMLDGQDGLAASVAFFQLLALLFFSLFLRELIIIKLSLLLLVSLFSFLLFNFPWRPNKCAKVFLGDAGSMGLALVIGCFAIKLTQSPGFLLRYPAFVLAWFLAYPVFDLFAVSILRVSQKKSPLEPGRDHLHHFFAGLGYNKRKSVLLILLINVVLGLLGGLTLYCYFPLKWSIALFVACFLAYLFFYFRLFSRSQAFLGK